MALRGAVVLAAVAFVPAALRGAAFLAGALATDVRAGRGAGTGAGALAATGTAAGAATGRVVVDTAPDRPRDPREAPATAEAPVATTRALSSASSLLTLATAVRAASRSATRATSARLRAVSTSPWTRATRLARLDFATSSSSSANVEAWTTFRVTSSAPGRASRPWAASIALAMVSSPKPLASWT